MNAKAALAVLVLLVVALTPPQLVGASTTESFYPQYGRSATMTVTAANFTAAQGATVGTAMANISSPTFISEVEVDPTVGPCTLTRSFLHFDTSNLTIPAGSAFESAYVVWTSNVAPQAVVLVYSMQANPIVLSDFDACVFLTEIGHVTTTFPGTNRIAVPESALSIGGGDGLLCLREYAHDFLNVSPVNTAYTIPLTGVHLEVTYGPTSGNSLAAEIVGGAQLMLAFLPVIVVLGVAGDRKDWKIIVELGVAAAVLIVIASVVVGL